MLPIVLHIPHSSKAIPSEIRYQFLLSDDELSNELNRMTDAFTDDLFSTKISIIKHTIVYPVSRLVVDPERFIDDDKEVMSKKGNCVKLFQQMGYSIKMNSPFSGSIA
jgi:N-formylglutamate amidohydrolase